MRVTLLVNSGVLLVGDILVEVGELIEEGVLVTVDLLSTGCILELRVYA